MLKINIMNSGNHNNLYCSAKKDGIKLKLVMFLDTERSEEHTSELQSH